MASHGRWHGDIYLRSGFIPMAGCIKHTFTGRLSQIASYPRERFEGSTLEGMPLGKLEIPRLNRSVMVLKGLQEITLQPGTGHIPHTVFPAIQGMLALPHIAIHFPIASDIKE
jgi:hypothetical protein